MEEQVKKHIKAKLYIIQVLLEAQKSSGYARSVNINSLVWSQKGLYELIEQLNRDEITIEDPDLKKLIDLAENLSGPIRKLEQTAKQIQVKKDPSFTLPIQKHQPGGDPALAVAVVMGFLLDCLKRKKKKG